MSFVHQATSPAYGPRTCDLPIGFPNIPLCQVEPKFTRAGRSSRFSTSATAGAPKPLARSRSLRHTARFEPSSSQPRMNSRSASAGPIAKMVTRPLISITPFSSNHRSTGREILHDGGRSFRHFHALAHHGSCELLHSHGFPEQGALNHVETQFA